MNIIGLTGNTGSGKSHIASLLKGQGAYIINADKVGHKVLQKDGAAYSEVIGFFGNDILDGKKNINRKALGAIVFKNKESLNKLNSMVHKYIVEIIIKEINEVKDKGYSFIVIDAPLLIETNLHKICDKIIVVYADTDIRLNRIMQRDNISRQEALNRINSQTHFDDLKKYADIVIVNNKNDNCLKEEIKSLLNQLAR